MPSAIHPPGSGSPGLRMLVLLTDAYGGRGGIAKFNRDWLSALCTAPDVASVTALPRLILDDVGDLPARLEYAVDAAEGKRSYARALARMLRRPCDVVLCGHVHLLPLAALMAWRHRAPLVLTLHGIEAWSPPSRVRRWAARRVTAFVAVSDVTLQRFLAWSAVPPESGHVIPNCVALGRYGPGPKRADLLDRYGLHGRTVLLTVGRLAGRDRHKGFDEVLDVLPAMRAQRPDLAYLIVGDGPDRTRLEEKAAALGQRDHVVFAGYVDEVEKADHYRLGDAYVMPSRGEGFGIVFLEAMASGLPVIASSADASQEAVLGGALGQVVDPDDPAQLRAAIEKALSQPPQNPSLALDTFSDARFRERWHAFVDAEIVRLRTPR